MAYPVRVPFAGVLLELNDLALEKPFLGRPPHTHALEQTRPMRAGPLGQKRKRFR